MKILKLRKKNILSFSISAALALILAAEIFFNTSQQKSLQGEIDKINAETSQIKSQTSDLESKASELKKYRALWDNLPESKKSFTTIKIDDVNSRLSTLADKYSIFNQSIKLTLPEALQSGVFDRSTIIVSSASATLSFYATTDVKAILFVKDFIESLTGHVVVTNFTIKKEKKEYTDSDLISISSGKGPGNVSAKLEFFWYTIKDKKTDVTKNYGAKKADENKSNSKTSDAE